MHQKALLLLTLGWLSVLSAAAQGSPAEMFMRTNAEAVEASAAGDYQTAIAKYDECIAIMKANWPTHEGLPVLINNLAMVYGSLGQYEEEVKLMEEALAMLEANNQQQTDGYALIVKNLCLIYPNLGKDQEAIQMTRQALSLMEKNGGKNSKDYINLLSSLPSLYYNTGDYTSYEKTLKETLALMESNGMQAENDYAILLSNLCIVYYRQGKYEEALTLTQKSLAIAEKALGKNTEYYATLLSNISTFYHSIGDYSSEEKCIKEALQIFQKINATGNPHYAQALVNMGGLSNTLGNSKQAEQYYLQASEIQKALQGGMTEDYATTLNNLGTLYTNQKRYKDAARVLYESMRISKALPGKISLSNYAMALMNLSHVYGAQRQYREQEKCLLEALEIQKSTLGEHHPQYAITLANLGSMYDQTGRYDEEEKYLLEALRVRKAALGERHPDYAASMTNLGVFYANRGKYAKADSYITRSSELTRQQFLSAADYLSERQRNDYWNKIRFPFEHVYPLYAHRYRQTKPAVTAFAYDNALFVKGLLLSTSNTVQQAILSSGDTQLINGWKELVALRQDIQRQQQENPGSESLQAMYAREEEMEKALLANSAAYREVEKHKSADWKEVQKQLGDDDLAIEFLRLPFTKDTICYCALVLQKKSRNPEMIDLCLESDLMDLVPKGRPSAAYDPDFLEERRNLSNLIWGKLQPYMKPGGKVYFSPDGALYQVAIEYLPLDAERTFADVYNLYRLSSTRELCFYARTAHSRIRIQDAVLFGGLQYDLTRDVIAKQSQSFRSVQPAGERDEQIEMLLSDSTRGGIAYLPATLREVEEIRAILNNPDDRIFTGKDGNEESFKALSGRCPGLLHIGTHGFYLPPRKNEKPGSGPQLGDNESQNRIDYSMSRTGLLMAGAQLAWSGQPVPEGVEDGILTAKEIAGLDLRTVECAVLSACETGNGDITGDGVAGLQRGFKQAGVKTLMMSLWPVSDNATQLLMTEFYRRWKNGSSKREALRQAQHVVRERFEEPEYWAAFILLDSLEEE